MAKLSAFLPLFLTFLCVFHGCLAKQQQQQQRNRCDIQRLDAQEPRQRIQAEAGVTEFWDRNDEQFQCAEVALIRHVIQRKGLLLPSYTSTPLLAYVQQGRGVYGLMVSGCPETFQSSQSQTQGDRKRRFQDEHQKIEQIREGDILAIPNGAAHWVYNEGEQDLVLVVLEDSGNNNNQLDSNPRRFFIAGNPQQAQGEQQQEQGRQGQQQEQGRQGQHQEQGRQGQQQEQGRQGDQPESGNLFNGFDVETLAEEFNVNRETASKLQSQDDKRGHIVRVEEGLQVLKPPTGRQGRQEEQQGGRQGRQEEQGRQGGRQGRQEEQQGGRQGRQEEQGRQGGRQGRQEEQQGGRQGQQEDSINGIEETICSARTRQNIDDPSKADVYNRNGGRFTTVNGYTLPILNYLRLSAERGVLYKNAMMAPHWYINAHGVMYVTRGQGRIQIVDHRGQAVYDGEIQKGQAIVVPMNFAVVKQAGNNGLEWVGFNTNENAMFNTLAGRTSAFRGLPASVIANSYQISIEEAQKLKLNRDETIIFSPGSRSQQGKRASE